MSESIFTAEVRGEVIYGIRHAPAEGLLGENDTAIVMLHGWAGYRTGPHDMLVKFARRLTNRGYECFRFDFRGRGYSQGDRRQVNHQSMFEDLEAVLQYIDDVPNIRNIVLIGICSGAKLALHYVRSGKRPIMDVIAMSCPLLRYEEGATALAAGRVRNTLGEYAKKLFRRETWLKFFDGEIRFSAVWRNITRSASRLSIKNKKVPQSRSGLPVGNAVPRNRPFEKFTGGMLLIHGEKDPETEPALMQIHEMLRRHRVPTDTHIVKGANHSFYSSAWEKEIAEKIESWLAVDRRSESNIDTLPL